MHDTKLLEMNSFVRFTGTSELSVLRIKSFSALGIKSFIVLGIKSFIVLGITSFSVLGIMSFSVVQNSIDANRLISLCHINTHGAQEREFCTSSSDCLAPSSYHNVAVLISL